MIKTPSYDLAPYRFDSDTRSKVKTLKCQLNRLNMANPKCGCSECNPIACWACQELASKESAYESNVELDYDPELSLDGDSIEHAVWLESIVLDENPTYHALHDYGDDLPDYF